MDHGIESTTDERKAVGKPLYGQIRLTAGLEGTNAFIKVEDDGRGIDSQRILESANKKGLDTTHIKTESDAINLIFKPGFSTAQEVTDTSGRGVGMDSVRTSVESIGGTVTVSTKIGFGSQFLIKIPIGMSVIQALEIKVNNTTYALNSDQVVCTKKLSSEEITVNGKTEFILFENNFIPCISLNRHFVGSDEQKTTDLKSKTVCIATLIGNYVAILADEIVQSTTLVTKPLPALSGSH